MAHSLCNIDPLGLEVGGPIPIRTHKNSIVEGVAAVGSSENDIFPNQASPASVTQNEVWIFSYTGIFSTNDARFSDDGRKWWIFIDCEY
mmetsp:Transcript_64871/g.173915  ORF Transcript_64871/g.173915 Transcript_64871/m.173915 type:complete len:89 (-) Transcript_64871:181-447(-)